MKLDYLRKLLKIKQISILLISMIMYFLGGGLAHYYGADYNQVDYWLGLLWIICVLNAGFLLITYFSAASDFDQEKEFLNWYHTNRKLLLQLAFFFLTICGFIIVLLIINNKMTFNLGFIFTTTIIGFNIMTISPFSRSNRGYQEILMAIYVGCLIPSTSFFILNPEYHKGLLFITFPLTCIALVSFLAYDFSTFARDQTIDRKTFLRTLTWQTAIPVHNSLLIGSYIFFASGYIFGFPISFIWPALLTLPLACLQIYWLYRISRGGRPIWKFFNVLITSVFGLTAYFITFTFWIK
jgi:1,4-dihydroxy-2-naphthoate octaprenyltransferase